MSGTPIDTVETHDTWTSGSDQSGTSITAAFISVRNDAAIGEVPFSKMCTVGFITVTAVVLICVTTKPCIMFGEIIEGNVAVIGNVSSQDRDPNSVCPCTSNKDDIEHSIKFYDATWLRKAG